jgi:hypothetical protein
MFPTDLIYDHVFQFSEDQYDEYRDLVLEDKKRLFRLSQVENEGNDPAKTNMSFGTPHDIASMHIANKFYDPRTKENVAGPGRPKESGMMGKHKDDIGRDPIGAKEMTATYKVDTSPEHKFKGGSPLSTEGKEFKGFIASLNGMKSKAVTTSLLTETTDIDAGTFLDETKLDEINDI